MGIVFECIDSPSIAVACLRYTLTLKLKSSLTHEYCYPTGFHYPKTLVVDFPSKAMLHVTHFLSHHHSILYLRMVEMCNIQIKNSCCYDVKWNTYLYQLRRLSCLRNRFSLSWITKALNHRQFLTNFQRCEYLSNLVPTVRRFCHQYHRHDLCLDRILHGCRADHLQPDILWIDKMQTILFSEMEEIACRGSEKRKYLLFKQIGKWTQDR